LLCDDVADVGCENGRSEARHMCWGRRLHGCIWQDDVRNTTGIWQYLQCGLCGGLVLRWSR